MRITVVGDVLLDVDLVGAAERFSPDGPVPVVDVESSIRRPGGAGLVATMLARDGHDVTLVTVLADDDAGREIRAALSEVTVVAAGGAQTPVKTRVRAAGHPIARLDEGCATPEVPEVSPEMLEAVAGGSAVIVADYGRRLTENAELRRALDAAGHRVPLVWDPHPRGADPVASTLVVTPNSSEASRATGISTDDVAGAARAAEALAERWGCAHVAVTLGSRGALLTEGRDTVPLVVSAPKVQADDPCGAGDRLAASLAVALARHAPLSEALRTAVADASAYLAAGGVAALDAPASPTPLPRDSVTALSVARATRDTGGTVVATGGCFDLLHAGHAHALSAARALGDCLIVCLNSDASVRRLKGPTRPIMSEKDRVDLLLALECVDAVIVFDDDTPEAVLRQIEPDLWVKGGDYVAEELPEAAVLAEWGGVAVTVPFHPGRSSSALADALAKVS